MAVVSLPARGRPPPAAAGSEFVEKLLTDTRRSGTAGRNAGMLLLHPRPAPPLRTSSWLLAVIPRRPGRRCRRPTRLAPSASADLDYRPGAAVLGRPAPLRKSAMTSTRLPLLSDSAACFAWSRHTTTVKNDEERRLLLPPTRHRHPEHGPGDPGLGVPQLRVVGEVAGKAHAGLGHAASRAVCPALGPGGRWTLWHAERAPGQATEPTKSAMDQAAEHGRLRCRVGWRRLAAGVGHASTVRPDPSTLGVVGERGSHHEGRCRPGSGSFPR